MQPARLALSHISKRYPGVVANDDVSLTVQPGEIHAVLGENGAGKSTLMKIIFGMVKPDSGMVQFNGEPITIQNPKQAKQLGIAMVFQHFSLFDSFTVAENVWLGLDNTLNLEEVIAQISRVASQYGLDIDPHRPVHTLSVGEMQRVEIIRDLRLGKFDVLVGINLLREGLDIPEVSLVAILDADKEGFLRSERSLIQTIGRAARNLNGRAILYADRVTDSMQRAMGETERRRNKQLAFNLEHGIEPRSVRKAVRELIDGIVAPAFREEPEDPSSYALLTDEKALAKEFKRLEKLMLDHARNLEFEQAAAARDALKALKDRVLLSGA